MARKTLKSHLSRRELFRMGVVGAGSSIFGMSLLNNLFMKEAYGVTALNPFYDTLIHIFMNGGPSQTDTFDPKPGSANNIFPTSPLGVNDKYGKPIHLSNHLSKLAATVQAGQCSLGLVRSLVHNEADHDNARLVSQAYWRTLGPGLLYPSMASVMAYYNEGRSPIGIPSVAIDNATNDNKGNPIPEALNARMGRMTGVMRMPVTSTRYARRQRMLQALNADMIAERPDTLLANADQAWAQAYDITTRGTAAAAFDLTNKPLVPAANNYFAQKVTLAQELTKAGVPYIALRDEGQNDSHSLNQSKVTDAWANNIDPAVAQLVKNLQPTGKRVLILIGGEFGRTPQISFSAEGMGDGRDHWRDGFTWGLVSINQPKFRSGAYGDTGPDGMWQQRTNTLIDPVEMEDIGAFLYRAAGFSINDPANHIPLLDRRTSPVDAVNKSASLLTYFGLV